MWIRLLELCSRFIFWRSGLSSGDIRDFSRDTWDSYTRSQNSVASADDHGVATSDFEVPVGPFHDSGAPVPVRKYTLLASRSSIGVQDPLPVLLYFHGGGFCIQTHQANGTHALLLDIVKRLGCVAYSVGYRLAPEHPFPAALHDAYAVLRFVHGAAEHNGADLIFGGDSAGGNLALVLSLLTLKGVDPGLRPVSDEEPSLSTCVRHLMLLYPALFEPPPAEETAAGPHRNYFVSPGATEFFRSAYLGANPEERAAKLQDWRVAPMRSPMSVLQRLPSISLVSGGLDQLCPSNKHFAAVLQELGREVTQVHLPDAVHGFLTFPSFAVDTVQREQTLARVVSAVRRAVRGLPHAGSTGAEMSSRQASASKQE